jgi:25S rRNA (uracil2843-N3)-methyltransferase
MMGKNGRFGKDYGAVVGKDTKARPGWKGPGYIKKAEPPKSKRATQGEKANSDAVLEAAIPVELQQLLLNVYRDTFPTVLVSDTLQTLLQEVKKALYERDFTRAFGKEEFLDAYSIRWSPSRTLCYQSVLVDLLNHITKIVPPCNITQPELELGLTADNQSSMRVVSFGGGAAEVVAFGGFLRYLQDALSESGREDVPTASEEFGKLSQEGNGQQNDLNQQSSSVDGHLIPDSSPGLDLYLVDTAQWQNVVNKLHDSLTTPPPLSKYASSSAKEANEPLTADANFSVTFRQDDILAMSGSQLVDVIGGQPLLLTLLFTLNELYTSSIGKTTAFLLNLTAAVKSGSLLLVVDSPGSYSETAVGTEAKKYPMHWLLDHTLLETQTARGDEDALDWVKVVSEDSKWFRVSENLRYPIPLENMRYQMHLYRRV